MYVYTSRWLYYNSPPFIFHHRGNELLLDVCGRLRVEDFPFQIEVKTFGLFFRLTNQKSQIACWLHSSPALFPWSRWPPEFHAGSYVAVDGPVPSDTQGVTDCYQRMPSRLIERCEWDDSYYHAAGD
jgi:hypothetical protein